MLSDFWTSNNFLNVYPNLAFIHSCMDDSKIGLLHPSREIWKTLKKKKVKKTFALQKKCQKKREKDVNPWKTKIQINHQKKCNKK